jgi:hypothetical protein
VVVIGLVIAVLLVLWLTHRDSGEPASSSGSNRPVTITYKVTGTARSADITMETPSGTSQQSGIDVPLVRKSASNRSGISLTFSPGDFVYISAQNAGTSGTIECSIEADDGTEIARVQSSGDYAIATCDGSAR